MAQARTSSRRVIIWTFAILATLGSAVALGFFVFRPPTPRVINDPAEIASYLQGEYQVLLRAVPRHYQPVQLQQESDLFSTWGIVLYKRRAGGPTARQLLQEMVREFVKDGWRRPTDKELEDLKIDVVGLEFIGTPQSVFKQFLFFVKELRGENDEASTTFRVELKLDEGGDVLAVYYRTDAN